MDDNDDIRIIVARGLSALKIMIEERTVRIDKIETRAQSSDETISQIRERLAKVETSLQHVQQDVTGSHDLRAELAKSKGKEMAVQELKTEAKTDKQIAVDSWKASAPIYVAIVSVLGALITGVVNIVLHFLD